MKYRGWSFAASAVAGLLLLDYAAAEVSLDAIAPRLATADVSKGEKIFLQCKACHVASPQDRFTVGPNLWNLIDRPVGSQTDYPYSDALKSIGGRWDYEQLSRYLFDPKAMAPATRMVFPGVKRVDERAHLIAYLRTLHDSPPALPDPAPDSLQGPTYGGLPDGRGRDAVYFTCRACHGINQFTSERNSREQWDGLLVEMVAKNGMEAPEPWARQLMLDYLSDHFGAEEDDWQGLPPGTGREEVFYTCNACHSLKLVQQQGMSRARWDDTLAWMVEEQGMEEIEDASTRDRILDYLSTHFGG